MSYYTETHLINWFEAMIDDVIACDMEGNLTTQSGTPSPLEGLLSLSYDREFENYKEENDWECSEEDAHTHAINTYKEEAIYYLTENIETDDPYEYLDDILTAIGYTRINVDTLRENIFAWIGYLPIEWVHAKLLNTKA